MTGSAHEPSVLMIHGIGQEFKGPEVLKSEWVPALRDGLREAGWDGVLEENRVRMVSYGSLFRKQEASRGVETVSAEALGEDSFEAKMIELWWKELHEVAAQPDTLIPPALREPVTIQGPEMVGTRGRTPQIVQAALLQLARSRFFSKLGPQNILLGGLRQVRHFLHDAAVKAEALERVAKGHAPSVKVVIGHSLGSVVAYEALCRNDWWNVDTFITLGSPLGIPQLIFDQLSPKPVNGKGHWPHVRRWVNIADRGDIVALSKTLAPLFGNVEDALVYNGWGSHDAGRYLSAKQVGRAVAEGLGLLPKR